MPWYHFRCHECRQWICENEDAWTNHYDYTFMLSLPVHIAYAERRDAALIAKARIKVEHQHQSFWSRLWAR